MGKMRNKPVYICLILFGLILYGCDPEVSYHVRVINFSEENLVFKYIDHSTGELVHKEVQCVPGQRTDLQTRIEIGRQEEFEDCPRPEFTILITDSGKFVPIDSNKAQNWSFNVLFDRRFGSDECECVLVINENELVDTH